MNHIPDYYRDLSASSTLHSRYHGVFSLPTHTQKAEREGAAEEHYFLRAWKLRQGRLEWSGHQKWKYASFQFLFARAQAGGNGEGRGESHIEAIFFFGSGAAEWNWAIFAECNAGSSS